MKRTMKICQTSCTDKNSDEIKTPKDLGLDAVKLQEAIRFAETHESSENRNLKIAHYESSFGREPFGFPVDPEVYKIKSGCSAGTDTGGHSVD